MPSPKRCATIALALVTIACNVRSSAPTPVTRADPTNPPQSTAVASAPASAIRSPTSDILQSLHGRPCPESKFTCITVSVPLDHSNSNSRLITVTFAILPATGERKGFFVTATGGPGSAGIAYADSYTDGFDPSLLEHFDVVFFDQRGIGLSGGFTCPGAVVVYYDNDANPTRPEGEAALLHAAQTFAADCIQQSGQADVSALDYYGTRQAVEDLEALRQIMGDEQFWLYGESYGTQFAQMYAAAHPDHLAGLILDGTVDLTRSGPNYLREQARAFGDVMMMTLEACNADPACAADTGGNAVVAYDSLAAQLAVSPVGFVYPLSTGGTASRTFTLSDLELTAAYNLYSPPDRTTFLRALAAANRGDFVPIAELHYDALGINHNTLEAIPDPTYSDAMYYSVECNDYQHFGGTADEQALAYIRAGDEVDTSVPRLGSIFYGDLPCAFWPVRPDSDSRPQPLVIPGVPTLILAASADPATPYSNSLSVFNHLADGYLVTMEGGPHVIFGRGDPCPDNIVNAFLVEGKMPAQRQTTCPGIVIERYEN